jgi:hypothetical protein
MHQSLQGATFHIEHVMPRGKGGVSDESNLALACPSCNLHKADRTHATAPLHDSPVPLFHPRRDRWREHFAWSATRLMGLTPVGRATVEALALNQPRRLRIREAEARFGLFPPQD